MIIETIRNEVAKFHLLKHDYYQRWNKGELSIEDLKIYSCQYFHHVDAFPRYISTIHSKCDDITSRQILLDNLIDEEKGAENHPELWLRFAESVGATRQEVKDAKLNPETKKLVDGFFNLCNQSYAMGLGALFAYENQVPEVAKSKIDGLEKFYGIRDERGIKFFKEHITADQWHSEEVADLIKKLPQDQQEDARIGALTAAKLLWNFLDGVNQGGVCTMATH